MDKKGKDKATEMKKYSNNVLLFETADTVTTSDILGRYPMAAAPRNPNQGPAIAKKENSEKEFIVRGFKWVSYKINKEKEVVELYDATGKIEILLKFISEDVSLYKYPKYRYVPKNVHKSNL